MTSEIATQSESNRRVLFSDLRFSWIAWRAVALAKAAAPEARGKNDTFSSFFFALNSGNPLDDLNALQKVTFVMKAGPPINRDTL